MILLLSVTEAQLYIDVEENEDVSAFFKGYPGIPTVSLAGTRPNKTKLNIQLSTNTLHERYSKSGLL